MTNNIFNQALRLCVLLTAALIAVLQPARAQTQQAQIYDGSRSVITLCSPNARTWVVVVPGVNTVQVSIPSCICADSKEAIQKIVTDGLSSTARGVPKSLGAGQYSFNMQGDGTTTKTFYCYNMQTLDQQLLSTGPR